MESFQGSSVVNHFCHLHHERMYSAASCRCEYVLGCLLNSTDVHDTIKGSRRSIRSGARGSYCYVQRGMDDHIHHNKRSRTKWCLWAKAQRVKG
jgi:hypothetical protein